MLTYHVDIYLHVFSFLTKSVRSDRKGIYGVGSSQGYWLAKTQKFQTELGGVGYPKTMGHKIPPNKNDTLMNMYR